jgi:hypothetical protein
MAVACLGIAETKTSSMGNRQFEMASFMRETPGLDEGGCKWLKKSCWALAPLRNARIPIALALQRSDRNSAASRVEIALRQLATSFVSVDTQDVQDP